MDDKAHKAEKPKSWLNTGLFLGAVMPASYELIKSVADSNRHGSGLYAKAMKALSNNKLLTAGFAIIASLGTMEIAKGAKVPFDKEQDEFADTKIDKHVTSGSLEGAGTNSLSSTHWREMVTRPKEAGAELKR